MATSSTQRTLIECRRRDWFAWVVEKWVPIPKHPAGGVRRDMYNIIDVIALDLENGLTYGIQACSGSTFAAHVAKLKGDERANSLKWLSIPTNRLEVWGWRKLKSMPGRRLWYPKIESIKAADVFGEETNGRLQIFGEGPDITGDA